MPPWNWTPFFVSSPENRRYLSGFAGSAGYLLISRDAAVLATDFRYTEQAELQAPDFRVDRISGGLGLAAGNSSRSWALSASASKAGT